MCQDGINCVVQVHPACDTIILMSEKTIVQQVVDEFVSRGIDATHEFPGACVLTRADGLQFWTSDLNETWTIDKHEAPDDDGLIDDPVTTYDTKVSRRAFSPKFIADRVMRTLLEHEEWFNFRPEGA